MKHTITIETEATPEEIAELIKRVGSDWADVSMRLTADAARQTITSWPETMTQFWQQLGQWGR